MQKVRRYSWQEIETQAAEILSPRLGHDAVLEGAERLQKITEVFQTICFLVGCRIVT